MFHNGVRSSRHLWIEREQLEHPFFCLTVVAGRALPEVLDGLEGELLGETAAGYEHVEDMALDEDDSGLTIYGVAWECDGRSFVLECSGYHGDREADGCRGTECGLLCISGHRRNHSIHVRQGISSPVAL